MKKSNRLASLFLAMLMALSCMAVPAMAAGDEMSARIPGGRCPKCGDFAWIPNQGQGWYNYDCPNCGEFIWWV